VLRTQTSDPTTTLAEPVEGATLVAEATTAEAALADVHDRLGPDARILDARRVLRGGVGGFFAREVVQVHAAPAEGAAPRAVSPIDRLLADAETAPEAVDFATYLRDQLGRTEPSAAPATSPAAEVRMDASHPVRPRHTHPGEDDAHANGVERPAWADGPGTPPAAVGASSPDVGAGVGPVVAASEEVPHNRDTEPTAAADGGPRWSVTTLVRLGLPPELVRSIRVDERSDDVAWTAGLAAALRPLCRPLPAGRSMLVGPRARGLAKARNIPVTSIGQPIRTRGDSAAAVGAGKAGQTWLAKVSKGRWLHLVVGGQGWRTLLHADPLAVSWAGPEDLPEAIRTAGELGLVLGHGPLDGRVRRARPLDVALAVRDLVPGR
jgi:hypothetical protein